jgi:hypothetical protein
MAGFRSANVETSLVVCVDDQAPGERQEAQSGCDLESSSFDGRIVEHDHSPEGLRPPHGNTAEQLRKLEKRLCAAQQTAGVGAADDEETCKVPKLGPPPSGRQDPRV